MNREALGPVLVVVPAITLVAAVFLFESTDYAGYRALGRRRRRDLRRRAVSGLYGCFLCNRRFFVSHSSPYHRDYCESVRDRPQDCVRSTR